MDSDDDKSLDKQLAACSDSALKHRFTSLLKTFATSCRRPHINGPIPNLQPYLDSARGTSVNSQASGVRGNNQVFLFDPNPEQNGSEEQAVPVEQSLETASEVFLVVQHPGDMLHVAQTQGHPCEMLHVEQQPLDNLLCDAGTQTSITVEGKKENSNPGPSLPSLPDVIYSSSSSSAHSMPTSPDVLPSIGCECGKFGQADSCNDVVKEHEKDCPLEAPAADDLSPASSDTSFQQSVASAIGQRDSQRSEAGKEKQRQFSSGYATQASRQSENSLATSCDDDCLVFSRSESAKDSLESSGGPVVTASSPSLENLSSCETVINWADSAQRGSAGICHENLPDFNRLLSSEECEGATSTMDFACEGVRDILSETSEILEMALVNEDETVTVEIHRGLCQPDLQEFPELRISEEVLNSVTIYQQLGDYAMQLISEGLTPAEVEVKLLESLDQNFATGNLNDEEDAAMEDELWSADTRQNCVGRLQIASACADKTCGNDSCLFFQELLGDMEDHLRNHTLLCSRLHCQLLESIVEHSAVCSEIRCTVPWCFFFHQSDSDQPEEQISRLLSLYRAFDLGVTREIKVAPLDTVEFVQLDETTNWPSIQSESNLVPENESDFEFLAPSTQFGQIAFYALSLGIMPKLLYVKMQSAVDGTHVWNRLRGLQHPNVVLHLWVYVTRSQAVVCSDALTYGDKSLEDVMKEKKTGLPMVELVRFTADILSAAEYLNRNHVFYLLWTADSVGLMADGLTVRLRDFSCSVDESRVNSDDGELVDVLCSALPPIILSPEMFHHNDIGRHSEVWGIGCLMFHLAQGSTVHRNLRHCDPDHIRSQVQRMSMDSVLRSIRNAPVRNILGQVFVEKSRRLQIEELREQTLQLQTS